MNSLTAQTKVINLEYLLSKVKDWRRKRGVQFKKSKYILIHVTRCNDMMLKLLIIIKPCCHPTSDFRSQIGQTDRSGPINEYGPYRSVGPRSFWIGLKSVRLQVHSPVGPVRLYLKNRRSYTWTGPRPRTNRGCASLLRFSNYIFNGSFVARDLPSEERVCGSWRV